MKQVCIICSKEASGIAVADTQVIRAIRAIKRKFNMAANNRLLVCGECMEEYKKRRKSFERKVMLYGAIGIGLIILSIAMPLMGGGNISLTSIFMVLLLAVFLLALAFLSYIPALIPSAQEGGAHSHSQENAGEISAHPAHHAAEISSHHADAASALHAHSFAKKEKRKGRIKKNAHAGKKSHAKAKGRKKSHAKGKGKKR